MNKGEEGWSTNIKDFSKLPEPGKYGDYYKFKGADYEEYVK